MSGPTISVVGLGPAGADLVGPAVARLVRATPPTRRYTRTDRHPAVGVLGEHRSFDDVYDAAASLDDVYPEIVARLRQAAVAAYDEDGGAVLYTVPGSPLVAERTVDLLRGLTDVAIDLHPTLSFLDLAWARLGVDPVAAGVRLVDGQRFATEAAGERGPLLVAQCDRIDVLSDIKLAAEVDADTLVTVLQRLGLDDEATFEVAWEDLDRSFEPDHLTSLWIPQLAAPVGASLVRFVELMSTLRRECPWDRSQTHTSLRSYLLEEAYEVIEAIDALGPDGEGAEELADELGDLLLQVVFHAEIARGAGWFGIEDVADAIHDKLVRRHPHVFGDVTEDDPEALELAWARIKAEERAAKAARAVAEGRPLPEPDGPFDAMGAALPGLGYAVEVIKRGRKLGLGLRGITEALDDVAGELVELREAIEHVENLETAEADEAAGSEHAALRDAVAAELGDVLYAAVNLARHLGVDAEMAVRGSANKVRRRAEHMVAAAAPVALADLELTQRRRLWQMAKSAVG